MANLILPIFLLSFIHFIHSYQDKCDAQDSSNIIEDELIMAQTVIEITMSLLLIK